MKRMIATGAAGVMLCVGTALGGGIDGSWVDQDAGWVAHIDVEGLMETRLGGALMDQIDADGGEFTLDEILAMLKDGVDDDVLGLAVMREVRDVTVVGLDDDEPDLVVARTSPVVHAMIEAMKNEGGIQMIEQDGHAIVSLNDHGEDGYAVVLPTDDKDTYRVVLSDTVDKLVGSIAAAHTRRNGPGWIDGAAGKLVFMHMDDPTGMAGGDLPQFLQDAGEVEFSLDEKNGMLDASLLIETGNEDAANSIVQMAQGMMAFARIGASEDPKLAELLELTKGLALRANGGAVMANLSVDVDALLETVGPMMDFDDEDVSIHIDHGEPNNME